jgi:predicted nucleic acid-binding protein
MRPIVSRGKKRMSAERVFLDTNVLLYWLDPADGAKQEMARRWVIAAWQNGSGRTSWQVLHEFYTNAVKKLKTPPREVRTVVEQYAQWAPIGVGLGLVQRAWYWMDRAGIAYWDGLIVAAAESANCRYLLSEDFQTGRRFGDVRIISPFQVGPEELFRS